MKLRVLSLLLALILFASLAACEAPGEGEKAEAGYAACQPVIDALAAYQAARGDYPDSLDGLVPDYLTAIPEGIDGYPLEYAPDDSHGYSLQFSYTGPGMNECVYTPDDGWSCSGYF